MEASGVRETDGAAGFLSMPAARPVRAFALALEGRQLGHHAEGLRSACRRKAPYEAGG